ncbi:MAG: glycosyltransferase, partial [Bacteroidota bacterium]
IQKVWPTIHQRFPELEFHIAGRNTPASLMQLKRPNVFVHGEVPESAPFIDKHCMMVVPLLSGSGMRAKILEGMALGKVVLSTSIGLEGISATHKKDVMVANTVDQYVDAVAYTLRSNEQLNQMAQQAQNFVFEQYASVNIAKRVMQAYSSQFAESV